ncbi:transcriptional regulator [Sanguibacter keddieii DSM 10542]|uniref:Transcriptional regulator n=1 Tax=Sanguibacter keddieii (strain ATCC 51767 / DSM 10542 / NCFB 3025 / ST-74) TaxID=446469 RepID=D1BCJ1_SANKS|nr:MarR family transcriptional regulator [Sanguibacter keddieii]ACZ22978.1 transcriptional regulator [Sanguibacter keddieii DSM 10542]
MTTPDACAPGTLGGQLRVALTRISRRLRNQRGEADLPEGQFAVLTTIYKHGPMTPGALADHEHIRPPSMTRTVNALAELGLVTKVGHETDKRLVLVELTTTGRDEVRETRRRREAWLTKNLGQLTPEERQTLAAASELLVRIASR